MLTRLKGIWLGDLNGKRVVIINPNIADQSTMRAVDDLIKERRDNGRRDDERQDDDVVRSDEETRMEV